jgi:dihydroorotate dehydrogenase (NAD+) catalytic subunit
MGGPTLENNGDYTNEIDLSVNLGGLELKNPVTVASGTFGYGREYEDYVPLSSIGGIIVKGTTLKCRIPCS